jgi:epoxyqueuosine reductase
LPDFDAREAFTEPQLLELLQWDESTFLMKTEGSAIRRIGHARWLRNVALAAGNALALGQSLNESEALDLRRALERWQDHPDPVLQEQVAWSLAQHR